MNRDVRFERALAFARDLVRIPSISGEEEDVARRVVDELKLLKFNDVWIDEMGNVLARVKGKEQEPSVMLCSHLDVVAAGDLAQWQYPPFSGEIAEGYLHGRGAMDCKGPLALQTYAAASLIDSQPEGDIYLAYTVLEERGSWGMAHIMEQRAIRPAAVVLGEATAGDICIGHRGRTELMIRIRGKSAHASAPACACNPIDLLPDVLNALRSFVEQLPLHDVLCPSTLAPTAIQTWPANPNMIPEEARIVVDWRMLPLNNDENPIEAMQRFLQSQLGNIIASNLVVQEVSETQRAYTGLERTGRISTAGFLLSESHPLVRAAVQAVQTATGHTPVARPWVFGTDGSYSCGTYGFPTIGYAPGLEAHAHTNRERLQIDAARTAYDVYPILVRELQRTLAAGGLRDRLIGF